MIKLLVDIFLPFVIAGLANQDDFDSDDCVPPTCKHRRICNEEALPALDAIQNTRDHETVIILSPVIL